jgi:aldose 1-epimerase
MPTAMDNATCFRTLCNSNGIEATFCHFGATLTALQLPMEDGHVDVVMGFPSVADYERSFQLPSPAYLGAVVGLHAGRVRNGAYRDGECLVQLERNLHGRHHLHGGSSNLSNSWWDLVAESEEALEYAITVNEGRTKVRVRYALGADDVLRVSMRATTEENVLVNLTQHSYFNLDGHQGDVTQQTVMVNASRTLETDADLLPTGRLLETNGTPFDFSTFQSCPAEIDHSFVLNGQRPAAVLKSATTGWSMEVDTDQPSIHVFVGGAHCNPIPGKDGAVYHRTSGICFEAQNFPDSPNHAAFRSGILRPGETYRNEIIFRFRRERSGT